MPQGNQVAATHSRLDRPAGPPKGAQLNINVDGQQYVWRYQYPRQGDKTSSPTRRWSYRSA